MDVAIELSGKLKTYELSIDQMNEYERMFPNVNVAQCLCSMRVWLDANPSRRPKNVKRFVANWLIREAKQEDSQWRAAHLQAQVGR